MAAAQVRGRGQVQVSPPCCQRVTELFYWESDMSVSFLIIPFAVLQLNINYRTHWPDAVLDFAVNLNN